MTNITAQVPKQENLNVRIGALVAVLALLMSAAAFAKPVELIMLDEGGCPWCERWDEEIGGSYAKTPEGRCAPIRRVDIHGDLPADLKTLRRGNYTPTFILWEEGREVGRIRGYPGEDYFYPMLTNLLERLKVPCATPPKLN